MLFGINESNYVFMEWGSDSFKTVMVNNFYYYTQILINDWGKSGALAALAAMLVVMTGLKTGSAYLASYFIIPMRSWCQMWPKSRIR